MELFRLLSTLFRQITIKKYNGFGIFHTIVHNRNSTIIAIFVQESFCFLFCARLYINRLTFNLDHTTAVKLIHL